MSEGAWFVFVCAMTSSNDKDIIQQETKLERGRRRNRKLLCELAL
jgi:hypothetical protein